MKKILFVLITILLTGILSANPMEVIDNWAKAQNQPINANDVVNFMKGKAQGDITYGAENVYNSAATYYISVSALDATHFVVAYKDNGFSGYGTAVIGSVSGTTVSHGAENVFNYANTLEISVSALDNTHFVVAYTDDGNSDYGTTVIGTVSGTTITFGFEYVFNSAATYNISVSALDATHFVVAYMDDGNSDYGTAVMGSVSGSTISYGAEEVFNYSAAYGISVSALDNTHFVVAYSDWGNSDYGTTVIGSVAGSTISYGADKIFNSAQTPVISVSAFDDTHFVVAYTDTGNSSYGTTVIGSVSGSTISYGVEKVFNSAMTDESISVSALDATHFVVAYSDNGNSGYGTAIIGTVSGFTITYDGAEEVFNYSAAFGISVSALDNTHFVVAYTDDGNSDYGTAIAGEVERNDYPSGQETVVDSVTTINPTADLNDAANQTIPPVPNGSFVAKYENVFTGSGIVNITFNTSYAYGAYYQSGSWTSVANSGEVILFEGINFDAKGDVPIVLGNENPLPVVLSSFTAIQTSDNLAQINWTTQSESNLSGYNVFRNTKSDNETAIKVNSEIIEGSNTSTSHNYSFTDKTVESGTTYYYWLESVDYAGNTELFGPINVTIENNDNPDSPEVIKYGVRNYPNPFNPETAIEFAVKTSGKAKLVIYNIKGQEIRTLFEGYVNAKEYIQKNWDGTNDAGKKVSSGIYMYKLTVGEETYLKKMVMLK